jgi:hypothetical protein
MHDLSLADGVLARAVAAFEAEVEAAGWVDEASGEVVVRGLTFRVLSASKPRVSEETVPCEDGL